MDTAHVCYSDSNCLQFKKALILLHPIFSILKPTFMYGVEYSFHLLKIIQQTSVNISWLSLS